MKITFLGTAAGKPSKYRNVTSIAIEFYNSKYILIDCGEATQHQIIKSDLKFNNLHSIFITHLHGDHIFGLPGLLASLNEYRTEPLNIYGPKGLIDYINKIRSGLYFRLSNYKLLIYEIENIYDICTNIVLKNYKYKIEYFLVKHGIPCYAYSITSININKKIDFKKLQPIIDKYSNEINKLGYKPINKIISDLKIGKRFKFNNFYLFGDDYIINNPNKRIVIILDNYNSNNVLEYLKETDILIHECSYAHINVNELELKKKARGNYHSTNRDAAIVAWKLKAKILILTHFSNRYEIKNNKMLVEDKIINDCKKYFNGLIHCAYDFNKFCILNNLNK